MADWDKGDEVIAKADLGGSGIFGSHVPEGTRGEVIETRSGLLNDYATVRFENGYTEEVKVTDLRRHSWW
jgi:hypothetical protein